MIKEDSGKKNLKTAKKKGLKNKGYDSHNRGGASKNIRNISRNGRGSQREAIITAVRLTVTSLDQQTFFRHVAFVVRYNKQLRPYPSSLQLRVAGQLVVPKNSTHKPKTQA